MKVSLVVWQPVLTDHQAYTLEELGKQSGMPVVAYVSRLQDVVRQAQGWTDTKVTSIERRLLPVTETPGSAYRRLLKHRSDIHLFGSPFEQRKMILSLLMAAALRLDFYLISEPYSPRPEGYFSDDAASRNHLKALFRPLTYRCYGMLIKRRVRGVFAISQLAVAQYRKSGVPESKLFPFGYFVPVAPVANRVPHAPDMESLDLRVVFVGSLIQRKGLDLLIEAVRRLRADGHSMTLDVYGPGNTESFGFDGQHVRYCGLIPFGQAQAVISRYDVLSLPSRYDGWGVVVNEALLARVPVLCSDQVGARALVETFGAGSVFASDNTQSLCDALASLLVRPERLRSLREATGRAALAIDPSVAAAYMWTVIQARHDSTRAIASPWYRLSEEGNE